MTLNWKGDALKSRMEKAAKLGINQTMSESVWLAKNSHPFQNRNGMAEGSIQIAAPAARGADGLVSGIWGSVAVFYFKFLEFGTRAKGLRSSLKNESRAFYTGDVMQPSGAIKGYATLIPTARITYQYLKRNIKEAWEGLA